MFEMKLLKYFFCLFIRISVYQKKISAQKFEKAILLKNAKIKFLNL